MPIKERTAFCDSCKANMGEIDLLSFDTYKDHIFDLVCEKCFELERTTVMSDQAQVQPNWVEIETALKTPTGLKTSVYAKEKGFKPADLKSLLLTRYGEAVEFRRGRNGGAFLKKGN